MSETNSRARHKKFRRESIINQPHSKSENHSLTPDSQAENASTAGASGLDSGAGGSIARKVVAAENLPTPDQLPDADWVIYDGNCVFCTRQVMTLSRLDGGNRLAFISLHDPKVQVRCPDLTRELMMEQMYIVTGDNRKFGGAVAVRYLTRRLPMLWIFAPLMHIPFTMPLWRWTYRYIANRRYKIAGKFENCDDGTCELHARN